MFKMIKYEYRKDMPLYIVVVALIVALTMYLAFSILSESEINLAISIILFILCGWGAVIFIMVIGVISYAREINSKSSFMTFMTPLNAFEIVGCKYITLIITTIIATALYIGGAYLNISLALFKFEEINDVMEMMDYLLVYFESNLTDVIATFLVLIFSIWFSILMTVSYAYLAITLSSTILANKRGKGWLAVGLYMGISVSSNIVSTILPRFDFGDSFAELLISQWPVFIFQILMIAGTYFGVSLLLKKKVSL